MKQIIVAGIGTDVGKTVASAVIMTCLKADYWKPIQCGNLENSDSATISSLVDPGQHQVYPPAYTLKAPLSPHHAARLEGVQIDTSAILPPVSTRPLVIESSGGVMVPLTTAVTTLEIFKNWNAGWVVVSRHYLGSINHTLLTIGALQSRGFPILGLIFNGDPNPDSEAAILENTQLSMIGRLLPEPYINRTIIQRYAKEWKLH